MIVVSDASVLINLDRIGQVGLLPAIYDRVLVPAAVWSEVQHGSHGLGDHPPEWITVATVVDRDLVARLSADLDAGESEAIALALERHADLLLIDEQHGRAIATRLGVKITGLIGVLVVAKHRRLIPAVSPCLRELAAAGFWLSEDLIARVLKQVGE